MAPRLWLITGASSGLGLALALHAAAQGDAVLATSRDPSRLATLTSAAQSRSLPGRITPAQLDPSAPAPDLAKAVAALLAAHGTPDVVVNNAAYVQTGVLEELAPETLERQFRANVFGPLALYRAVLPALRERRSGTLLSIGSMAAWFAMPGCGAYDASKAALRWLTLGLGSEVAGLGIKHCLIEPGAFRTALLAQGGSGSGGSGGNVAYTAAEERLPDYADVNAKTDATFTALNGTQRGDPEKAAKVMYEVVTGTGVAEGRELPTFLPLGSDACDAIKGATAQIGSEVEAWRGIASLTDFSEGA
ncbi:uncharacterized protein K452DRAFT_236753 [Aplosporella prunicola CBS 121167]|uniref:Ketoreductase domain-containing protein n=1 Tax=Aplosporella prunicola CBS 121167 TaxID=1176127 RepID=A0A6A6AYA1_9PEZI|nr:uncharacterized protein K452DRAFT_236753 [Aplosporella prunicola CBS 121167]KAF2136909.1 hypothetical protein K452DRAFT_236753 [Aplosporella prunicola CBS 121167]